MDGRGDGGLHKIPVCFPGRAGPSVGKVAREKTFRPFTDNKTGAVNAKKPSF
jgi:hypothetical protein